MNSILTPQYCILNIDMKLPYFQLLHSFLLVYPNTSLYLHLGSERDTHIICIAITITYMSSCSLCSGLLTELDVDFEGVRLQHPKEDYVKQFTFNSARKSMTTVVPLPNNKGSRVLTKGASEIVLSKCANILTATGEVGVVMHD